MNYSCKLRKIVVAITCLIFLLLAGCTGRTNQKDWEDRISRRMPIMDIQPALSSSSEEQPEPQAIYDLAVHDRTIDLSIEQAVMAVLQNNRDLKIQKLEPVKAGTFETIEKAAFDPEVFADVFYTKKDIRTVSEIDEEHILAEKTQASGLGFRKAFSTGTTIQTDILHERVEDASPEEQKTAIGLTLTQSLLNGFGPSVNLASVKQAKLDVDLSLQELRGFTETIIAETEIIYWQYILAQQKIVIFEQSLEIAKKQRDEIEQQISVGLLPQTEAAAARSEVALQDQALINAQSNLEEQRLKLLHLVNPERNNRIELQINPTSTPDIQTLPISDLTDRINLAEKSRADLNEARLRLEKNCLETIITKNGVLPRLDLFIALGRTGYGDSFSDAFKGLETDALNDFQVGLSLNHLIGNRESEAKNIAAVASHMQSRIAVENLIKLIDLDVRLAVNEVERTRKQIAAGRITRQLQEETFSAEKDRFDVGDSTTLLVAQAQRDLLVARIAEVEAIINFRIALVKLFIAEGSLLEIRGIRIES